MYDGTFGAGQDNLRTDTRVQARNGDGGDHRNVFRMRGGIPHGSALRSDLEFLFRAGPVDSVSDVQLGDRRADRRTCRGAPEKKQAPAFGLRNPVGGAVFFSDGYMDGAVGGRILQLFALSGGTRLSHTLHRRLRGVKCGVPPALCPPDRKDP